MIVQFITLIAVLVFCHSCDGFFLSGRRVHSMARDANSRTCAMMTNDKYPLQNDLMIRAAKGETVERTPIWIFRQAGRHLKEYNDYKAEKGKNFLELLDDPVDVAEVTMQPIRRYNLDAAILFSDILVILQAMGIEVTMPGGVGIQVPNPLKNAAEVPSRVPQSVNVREKLSHVIKAVELIKEELKGKVPLIGFSAAPWTLMYYLVGGSSKKNQTVGATWLKEHPVESKQILDLLTDVVIEYLSAQVEAGADMIQVFEAMGDFINEDDFYTWAMPCMTRIAADLKKMHPDIPLLVFPRGAGYSLEALQTAGYDVVTLDTKTDRQSARTRLSDESKQRSTRVATVQGNLDVALLCGGDEGATAGGNSPATVRAATQKLLEELGPQKLIANLGEGLMGKEDPVLVAAFIDAVHELSEQMISSTADAKDASSVASV
mmetsp:Transcript_1814/g.3138  ORF Transcript_1814/g.3138 Transcript_1814/m.3138 type:complete len:433 (-) Transcript_1814:248-1546(-)